MSARPLGIFDSGLGGLSVVRALWESLPDEETVYFGDTGRFPYGTRSPEVIRRFAGQCAAFLLEMHCKAIVVACNTASAHALAHLRQQLDVPVVGVVEPGVEAAVEVAKDGNIGLLATSGTVASGAYERELKRVRPDLSLISVAAPLFVTLVEEGWTHSEATELIAREYVKEFPPGAVRAGILGCTHFPLLRPVLSKVLGGETKLIDGAAATAVAIKRVLTERGMLRRGSAPRHRFFVSDSPEKFQALGPVFLGTQVSDVQSIDIESY